MTPDEHYAEAERLMAMSEAEWGKGMTKDWARWLLDAAQVHASLACARAAVTSVSWVDEETQGERDVKEAMIQVQTLADAERRSVVEAPWTEEQVNSLRARQASPDLHPYTCANFHVPPSQLVPTTEGWVCQRCDYTQNWAHASDVEGATT